MPHHDEMEYPQTMYYSVECSFWLSKSPIGLFIAL